MTNDKSGVAQAVTPREHPPEAVKAEGPALIRKQAIVVVHGQGQQRPMGTVREFVMSLWQYNPQLTVNPPPLDKGRDYWIVPDGKSGLFELQRVTTPPYNDGHGDRRTDFFELYYADLFENTPLRNLWRWLQRLLFVDLTDIPDRMKPVWRLLWVLTLIAGAVLVWVIFNVPTLLHIFWTEAFMLPREGGGWTVNWPGWLALGVGAVGVGIEHLPRLGKRFEWLGGIDRGFARVLVVISLVVLVIMMSAWAVFGALALVALGYFGVTFVQPLFGDAASYLSAQSETVQSRQSVRTRGLTLLRALHDDPDYDRIVVVAHSLGTVVAYDLMQLLWEAVGPTKNNPPESDQLAAIKKVEAFVATKAGPGAWSDEDVKIYQELQWNAFDILRRQPGDPDTTPVRPRGWKVSDFITLGSPLGNATFLVADGTDEFTLLKEERLMPTSPPQPYDPSTSATSFLDGSGTVTHHASVFSVVRWTNIWDPVDPGSIHKGDFISSPVRSATMFGEGIAEHKVTIFKKNGKSRGFTHNDYWRDPSGTWTAVLPHLTTLRDAVGIMRF